MPLNIDFAWLLASEGAAPPLQFRVDTALFSLIIFLILIFVLYRFAWKPIAEGLDKREKGIADNIENARVAREQAEANLRQYEAQLAGAHAEREAIIKEARVEAEAAKSRILAEAQAEAQRERDRAMADIEAARNQVVRELAEKSVDSAVTLAGNIVGRSLQKDDHAKLIEDSISRFTGA